MTEIEIIKAFKQGKRGNCVSIAVIKSAMALYGVNDVFIKRKKNSKGIISIKMRDGFETVVRPHELAKAARYSKFNNGNNKEVKSMAHLYYAAMAKRVLVEGKIDAFLGRTTLRGALRSLNNGENYMEGVRWLGLEENYSRHPIEKIKKHNNLIGASPGHCYFLTNGIVDDYGKPKPLEEVIHRSTFKTKYLIKLH